MQLVVCPNHSAELAEINIILGETSFSNLLFRMGEEQEVTAKRLSVSRQTVSNWVTGRYPVNPLAVHYLKSFLIFEILGLPNMA